MDTPPDPYIASPRESFQDSDALDAFRRYLLDVFNRARPALKAYEEQPDAGVLAAAERIAEAPAALSTRPLQRLLRAAVAGDESLLEIFGIAGEQDLESARKAIKASGPLLERVEIDTLADSHRLVAYDPARRAIIVNASHPFVRNHLDTKGAADVVRDLGAAELLTEAFLLDQDFPSHFVRQFLADRRVRRPRERYRGSCQGTSPLNHPPRPPATGAGPFGVTGANSGSKVSDWTPS